MIFNLLNKNKKNEKNNEDTNLIKMVALLIHAAKIDEIYSEKEKKNNHRLCINVCREIKKI